MMRHLFLLFSLLPFYGFSQEDTSAYNPLQKKVFSIINKVEEENRISDHLDPEALNSLPIGIIKEIGTTRYIIAIDSAVFKPTGAYFNAYMAIVFPNSNKRIAFAAKNIKFNPQGVIGGEQSKLVLVSNHSFQISESVKLNLLADGHNYVEWNCEGFQSVNLKGEFEFSGERMIPLVNGNPDTSKNVKATFEIHTNDIHHFLVTANITPFSIKGLDDWKFEVQDAVVDLNEMANHPAMTFPPGYVMEPAGLPQMWTGFYLKTLKITLPKELSKHDSLTAIIANNLMIDNTGFTGKIAVNNVFTISEGDASGWGFSLDQLSVSFVSNHLSSGSMKGKLKIPAMGNNGLDYDALMTWIPQTKETGFTFTVSPQSNLSFDAFNAKVDLHQSSLITVQKLNGKFKPKAVLTGDISFEHQNASTPKINFQDLTFITDAPYLTNGTLAIVGNNTDNSKVAKYPVSLSNFTLVISTTRPKFQFDAMINFMNQEDHSFSATTQVQFIGKVGESNGQQSWSFDRVGIGAIGIEVMTCNFYLNGTIQFKNDDPIFGDGFEGHIEFILYNVMQAMAEVNVQFGHTTYKYFYVDAFIPITIPVGTVDITRLMGGLYYHMRPSYSSSNQFYSTITTTPSNTAHRTKYIPDNSISLGFKAGVSFQTNKSEKALNGDAMLEVAFSTAGGLDFIRFDGAAYMMCTVAERRENPNKAPARGTVLIQYDNINKIFDATLTCVVNTTGITGNAFSKIHIEPQIWFVCVGKPTIPANINIAGLASAQAYIMVGNQLEPMAPPPSQVASLVSSAGLNNQRDESALANASGFVAGIRFGNSFYKSTEGEKFRIYAQFAYGAGLDMMLANFGPQAHCEGRPPAVGWNGWIAQGQLFAYLSGEVGVAGRISEIDFDIVILSGTVAAILGGKIPNPSYAYGAVSCSYEILGLLSGSFMLDFEVGSQCTIVN